MAYKKGESGNPQGRPPGTRNRITKDIKACYLEVFRRMGSTQGLFKWARANPDVFYGQISKLLPKGLEIKTDQQLQINIISAVPEPLPLPAEYMTQGLEQDTGKMLPEVAQEQEKR